MYGNDKFHCKEQLYLDVFEGDSLNLSSVNWPLIPSSKIILLEIYTVPNTSKNIFRNPCTKMEFVNSLNYSITLGTDQTFDLLK